MPDQSPSLLLDQNIPHGIAAWLRGKKPTWRINHVNDVGLKGQTDPEIFRWAQTNQAIVITYDEDFADTRSFPLGSHCGVIRLRVWPTTVEMTQSAIERILMQVPETELAGSLIIVDGDKIRMRRKP
jgi:predicted nuclease of predicted toxin-antitoxin system